MLQKIENYKNAIMQLEDAVNCYLASPQDTLYRDGLIQRFEFTVELAWKSLREYLEDQGGRSLCHFTTRRVEGSLRCRCDR